MSGSPPRLWFKAARDRVVRSKALAGPRQAPDVHVIGVLDERRILFRMLPIEPIVPGVGTGEQSYLWDTRSGAISLFRRDTKVVAMYDAGLLVEVPPPQDTSRCVGLMSKADQRLLWKRCGTFEGPWDFGPAGRDLGFGVPGKDAERVVDLRTGHYLATLPRGRSSLAEPDGDLVAVVRERKEEGKGNGHLAFVRCSPRKGSCQRAGKTIVPEHGKGLSLLDRP